MLLGLERIREFMTASDGFDTAGTRSGRRFTPHPSSGGHRPVRHGHVRHQFTGFDPVPMDRILPLGAEDFAGSGQTCSTWRSSGCGWRSAPASCRSCTAVSRQMFQPLWPGFDVSEVPIGSVTNGVHARTWLHRVEEEILDSPTDAVDGNGRLGLPRTGPHRRLVDLDKAADAPDDRHGPRAAGPQRALPRSLADWAATAEPAHPDHRLRPAGASYKRLTLTANQPERLKALLNHRPHRSDRDRREGPSGGGRA